MASTSAGSTKAGSKLLSKQWMLELFEAGFLSDITLKVGDQEIKAHKAVLAAKSPWFKVTFEERSEESNLLDITLPKQANIVDIEPRFRAVMAAIRYCYTGQYSYTDSMDKDKEPNRKTMVVLCLSITFAQKYVIDGLVEHCEEKYISSASVLFKKKSDDEVFDFVRRSYQDCIPEASTRNMIRTLSLEEFKRRINILQEEGKFREALERMKENPKAAADFLDGVTTKDGHLIPAGQCYCAGCKTTFRYTKAAQKKSPCCKPSTKRPADAEIEKSVKKTRRDP